MDFSAVLIAVSAISCCVGVHDGVNTLTNNYFEKFRRRTYVTPKSYLSFIDSYKKVGILPGKGVVSVVFHFPDTVALSGGWMAVSHACLCSRIPSPCWLQVYTQEHFKINELAERIRGGLQKLKDAGTQVSEMKVFHLCFLLVSGPVCGD